MRRWPFMKMTRTVTQALLGPSACRMYPVQPGKVYPNTRGRIEMDAAKCILCSICAKKCPTGALRVDRPGHTWEIDRFLCIQCGACAEACPKKCLTLVNQYTAPALQRTKDAVHVEGPPPPPPKPAAPPATAAA